MSRWTFWREREELILSGSESINSVISIEFMIYIITRLFSVILQSLLSLSIEKSSNVPSNHLATTQLQSSLSHTHREWQLGESDMFEDMFLSFLSFI